MSLYLIVKIAGQRVALPSDRVQSVVEIDTVTPVPLVARHVAGLAALRSRVLTIIDTLAALDLGTTRIDGVAEVVIVACDGHLYGLLVDEVNDVVSLDAAVRPVRAPIHAGWRRATLGLIEIEGDALLLIDPAVLVADPAAIAA